MTQPLKIIFMGTPDFACAALEALRGSAHEVVALYTQPPRPKGRGQRLQPSPTHEYADAHAIPVFTPKSLKTPQAQAEFAALKADIAVVAAYGLILPKAVLEAPQYGCVNIHASLLPRWRGASPIQRAIWAGDTQTGVTIMQMDEGLDTGPMIAKTAVPIKAHTTCAALHDDLCLVGSDLIVRVLNDISETGRIESAPQECAHSTYAPLLNKQDGRVQWSQSAAEIDRQIRALNPWPGVWSAIKTQRIKILEARPESMDETSDIGDKPTGTILNKSGDIQCGQGSILTLTKIQPAGKKAMDFASALNGGYIQIGDIWAEHKDA